MINPQYSMRYCIMNGYNDIFEEKTNMFSEHLRDGDVISDSYMHDAVRFNNLRALEILLAKGAIDTSHKNIGGHTPLHVAASRGNTECIKILLQHNSNPQADNEKNETPLFKAIEKQKIEAVKLLIPVSDINHQSMDCITPLHLAARTGNLDIVKLLIENGAKSNLLNKEGRNMLHMAAISGDIPTIAYFILLDKGGLKAMDAYNRTPSQVAFKPGVIQFLQSCQQATNNADLESKCSTALEGISTQLP